MISLTLLVLVVFCFAIRVIPTSFVYMLHSWKLGSRTYSIFFFILFFLIIFIGLKFWAFKTPSGTTLRSSFLECSLRCMDDLNSKKETCQNKYISYILCGLERFTCLTCQNTLLQVNEAEWKIKKHKVRNINKWRMCSVGGGSAVLTLCLLSCLSVMRAPPRKGLNPDLT